jgi:hypothetical protein
MTTLHGIEVPDEVMEEAHTADDALAEAMPAFLALVLCAQTSWVTLAILRSAEPADAWKDPEAEQYDWDTGADRIYNLLWEIQQAADPEGKRDHPTRGLHSSKVRTRRTRGEATPSAVNVGRGRCFRTVARGRLRSAARCACDSTRVSPVVSHHFLLRRAPIPLSKEQTARASAAE